MDRSRIKEEVWARSSLQNMPILLIVYESKEFGSVEKLAVTFGTCCILDSLGFVGCTVPRLL